MTWFTDFWRQVFDSFPKLWSFVNTPIGKLVDGFPVGGVFGELTILMALSGSIVAVLAVVVVVHIIKLFI